MTHSMAIHKNKRNTKPVVTALILPAWCSVLGNNLKIGAWPIIIFWVDKRSFTISAILLRPPDESEIRGKMPCNDLLYAVLSEICFQQPDGRAWLNPVNEGLQRSATFHDSYSSKKVSLQILRRHGGTLTRASKWTAVTFERIAYSKAFGGLNLGTITSHERTTQSMRRIYLIWND